MSDIVERLRNCSCHYRINSCADCKYEKGVFCKEKLMAEAADAIEELMPKTAKWVFGETNGHSWMKCSRCLVSQSGQTACYTYCPNCGARMEEDDERL